MSGANGPPYLAVSSNGVGVVPDSQLNTFVTGGAVVADLQNFVALSNMTAIIVGYTVPGDGGAGIFYYNPTATTADDGGATCIAPNGIVFGRWLRIGAVNAQPGVFVNTSMYLPFQFLLGGINPTTEYTTQQPGNFSTQALTVGVAIPSTSTVHEADGISSYVTSASPATNAVSGLFYVRALAPSTTMFGLNVLVTDNNFPSTVLGCEWDIGGFNPASIVYGQNMIGVFPNGTPSVAVAYQAAALDAGNPWGIAFNVPDGSAAIGMQLGSMNIAANSDSQQIFLYTRDSTNADRGVSLQGIHGTGPANLRLDTPGGGVIMTGSMLVTNTGSFEEDIIVTSNAGTLETFKSGVTTVGTITTDGTTTAYNTTSDAILKIDDGLIKAAQALSIIGKLKPRWFRWKSDPDEDSRPGFFAQQVSRVFPWAVTKGIRGKRPWQMDNSTMMPIVVRALQALVAENNDLRRRIAAVERRV